MEHIPPEGDKRTLRTYFKARRAALSSVEREAAAREIARFVQDDPAWIGAAAVMLYCALGAEVGTDVLFTAARVAGKSVLYPRCLPGEHKRLEVCAVDDAAQLCPGRFGILEPGPSCAGLTDPKPDLVLIPGLAFDRRGARLGFGGGFYDRFLADIAHPHKRLGLCYDFQIVQILPVDPWDVRLDGVVSEKGLLWF